MGRVFEKVKLHVAWCACGVVIAVESPRSGDMGSTQRSLMPSHTPGAGLTSLDSIS